MLRKGYVLLRRVFLFKHFTQSPRPKWLGGPGPDTHPRSQPPALAPRPRAAALGTPRGRGPRRCPCKPRGLPGARRAGAAGTTGGGASPQPGPPAGRSARREGGEELGTPGKGALGLLIPLKVTDQSRSLRGSGCAGGAGAAAGSGLRFRLVCGQGLPGPQAARPGERGSDSAAPEDRRPAGKSPKRPHRAFMELPPPW